MTGRDIDEDVALLSLCGLPQMGAQRVRRLLSACGSAGDALGAPASVWGEVLGARLSRQVRRHLDPAGARRRLRQLHDLGGDLLSWRDPDYPPWLAAIRDAPVLLYLRGHRRWLSRPAVAVVGSRRCSTYGRRVATGLAAQLSARGVCVVSGMARGIDGAAHEGALQGNGGSIAVLGGGVDVVYPAEHGRLYRRLVAAGLVLSEAVLGTSPVPQSFPRRNRIVSGLALAVVVVEAPQRSGALMTARLASEQGREIFAVPGEITNPRCAGCLALLRDGAGLVRDAEDILRELEAHLPPQILRGSPATVLEAAAGTRQAASGVRTPAAGAVRAGDAVDRRLLAALCSGQHDVDTLARQAGVEAAQVQPALLRLELQGLVERLPGQRYARAG